MNRKKIIILGPAYPYRGGNSLFVAQTYELLKNHFEVKIYNFKLLYPQILFPGTTQFDKSEEVKLKPPSIRVINSINPFNWIKVAKMLKEEDADLIIIDWWHPFFAFSMGTISRLIKKKYKNRILFITENVVSHEANKIDKILTQFGLKAASHFLVLSNQVEKELSQFNKTKPVFKSMLPSYDVYKPKVNVDVSKIKAQFKIPHNSIVLLYFGYVRKYKGLDVLLNSMPGIIKANPNTFLIIAGEFYEKPDKYFSIINKNKLESNVLVVNRFIPNEEVHKFYSIADLVVLPYKSATQSAVLNVAYSFNKPVLATNVEGLAEFIKDKETGIIVEPNSPKALEKGFSEFLKLRDKIQFEQNIEKWKKENSFENVVYIIEGILSEN